MREKLPSNSSDSVIQSVLHYLNDMEILVDRFYKLNYRLLSFLGLWPYKKSRLHHFYLINIPILSINITQLLKLYTSRGNFDIIKDILPVWLASTIIVIKYYLFDLNLLDIKLLMDNMIMDWNMWKSKEEIDIMKKFAHSGRMYTLVYTIYIYVFVSLLLLVTFIPPLMDVIIPLNESRPMELPTLGEYFINQEKHFYLIYCHMFFSIMIAVTILIATDTQLMVFCCHVSGTFAVIGFRLEHFWRKDATLDGLSDLQRKECYNHVSLSIKGHKRALEFVKRMESLFSYSLLVQCGLNVICMSICLYQISVLYGESIQILKFIAFLFCEIFHLFIASLSGQTIIDHSSNVYFKAYSGLWYEAPIEVRKLLILIMRRSFKPSQVTAGKIFVYCLDGFSTILRTSTSYFMVLLSIQ